MTVSIQPILYTDPQTHPHRACPDCGGDTYPPGHTCVRCERDRP